MKQERVARRKRPDWRDRSAHQAMTGEATCASPYFISRLQSIDGVSSVDSHTSDHLEATAQCGRPRTKVDCGEDQQWSCLSPQAHRSCPLVNTIAHGRLQGRRSWCDSGSTASPRLLCRSAKHQTWLYRRPKAGSEASLPQCSLSIMYIVLSLSWPVFRMSVVLRQ